MGLEIKIFTTGPLEVNTAIITNSKNKSAIVVDPGGNANEILQHIQQMGCVLKAILLTHAHFDHVAGLTGLCHLNEDGAVGIFMHKDDQYLLDNADSQAARFGMSITPKLPKITNYIADKQKLEIESIEFEVLHTPGHSPGSCSYYLTEKKTVFSGDTIFANSIGRTDLWGGNFDQLIASIREKIFALPAETAIIAGHGPQTTVGNEIRRNPFFQ